MRIFFENITKGIILNIRIKMTNAQDIIEDFAEVRNRGGKTKAMFYSLESFQECTEKLECSGFYVEKRSNCSAVVHTEDSDILMCLS
jgi:hypothetical protein